MTAAAAFGRAADYDGHAIVQRRVAERLAETILALPLAPRPRVLEIGCGTGFLAGALMGRMPGALWLLTDIAPAMIDRARARIGVSDGVRFGVMDGERPEAKGSFDLICSSLAAQWFADLPRALEQWRARLSPRGTIAFTTLAAGSFAEWREAHRGLPCGAHDYPAPEALAKLGLDVTVERHAQHHTDARAFLHALKAIGAGTARAGHRPLAPAQLRAVMRRFEAACAVSTYVIATCIASRV